MSLNTTEELINKFTGWARTRPDVAALALVGSYARNAANETSDVDLVLVTRQPDKYLMDLTWIQRFGQVDRHQLEDYGKLTSVRVWYKDGPEVEYGITDKCWAAPPLDEGTREVIAGGMRVLFEKEKILSRHQSGA